MGQYAEARKLFAKAIEVAPSPANKGQALRSMAMSYAFEGNCKEAAKYESQLCETYLAAKDFYNAGEIANELARVCIESGDFDTAQKWYQTGHDVGLREPGLKPDRADLWEFRWEHAQARLAARRGKKEEAQKHVAAAKAILDKGTNPDQARFFPYLTGYVAFLRRRLQDCAGRTAEGRSTRSVHPVFDRADVRKDRRPDASAGVLPQDPGVERAQSSHAFARPLAKKKLVPIRSTTN